MSLIQVLLLESWLHKWSRSSVPMMSRKRVDCPWPHLETGFFPLQNECSRDPRRKRPFPATIYSNGNLSLDTQTPTRHCEALMWPHIETLAGTRVSLQLTHLL